MRRLLILFMLGALVAPAFAQVHEYELDNGMTLLVREDHRAPVVVSQIWYKVGASYEHNGITGISHLLEHMMFKGTEKHGPGEFSRIIAEHGGRENAFTSKDFTAYFQQLEKSRLPISFELEADRMRNLTLPEEEFSKEREVVIEERKLRTEDNPRAVTYEQFNAAAFMISPYRHPTIGWMNDLENLAVKDLRQWYRHWYAPNNATLVVVGDVEPDQVYALAKQHFGKIPAVEPPVIKPRLEPPQTGERRITVREPAELPYLILGYHVPVLKTAETEWEPYALEVMAGVLSGGRSARLPAKLVRGKQIAAGANAGYSLYARQSEQFTLSATPARDHNLDDLEQALLAEIETLRNELVSEQELERIKAQVVANDVYERDSIFYQAMQMGILETVGLGWQTMEAYREKIDAVTPEQIRKVARKYLRVNNRTVATLKPLPLNSQLPGMAPSTTASPH
ncbi:M16 family metallopeptidase [Thiohalophilus thiocyanatoxydans]|uniref:Zinc protease n=1 Tax=Thiohalophilus thiocyanatoxydans TaxID=381308 RepID=A0A4R8IX59_9GAMM|nr:pitrilysin family protein [Thiohalophilus thiocyanatoxydans]TDY04110.1 zinc protease [Thiohalophilus thiocyanatoxydans]